MKYACIYVLLYCGAFWVLNRYMFVFCNFGNLFSAETRKTLRTGTVPTLNLPIKSHESKQSDDLPPREYLTLHVDDKAKPTVSSVCKPVLRR